MNTTKKPTHRQPLLQNACYVALLLSVGSATGCSGCMGGNVIYEAHYSDKYFTGTRDTYYFVGISDRAPNVKISSVYLKLSDGKIVKLAELSETTARDWVMQKDEVVRDSSIVKSEGSSGVPLTSYRVDASSELAFSDGKLTRCSIKDEPSGPFDGVQIGPSADGEFLSFPIKRKDLVRVFGEPERIETFNFRAVY